MSAEWVSAVAGIGTLIVIAATAIAAVVQLRHIRAANQLTGLLSFTGLFESDQIQAATHFIEHELPQRLREPDFIAQLLEVNTDRREHPELRVCDFLEQQGSYIKYGMIDRKQYMDLVGAYASSMWQALKPVVALRRAARDSGTMYENFEFVVSLDRMNRESARRKRPMAPLMPEAEWRALAAHYVAEAGIMPDGKPSFHPG